MLLILNLYAVLMKGEVYIPLGDFTDKKQVRTW